MKRVMVTGAAGMLGRAVVQELERRGREAVALGRAELDVTDQKAVAEAFRIHRPSAVVQCAAFTAVDDAEACEGEATAVNASAAQIVAELCQASGCSLVYPSTDYVFDGRRDTPYLPNEAPRPLNAYGRSKLTGERAALSIVTGCVVRTSWLYGAGGRNFVDTIRRLASEGGRIEVVSDQIGRPTWTATLAAAIADLLDCDARGVHHVTDQGDPTSWYGLARAVLASAGAEAEVVPVPTARFPRPAERPRYSVLDCSDTERVLGRSLPPWEASLAKYLQMS